MPSKPGLQRRGGSLLTRAPAEGKPSGPALGFSTPRKQPGRKAPSAPGAACGRQTRRETGRAEDKRLARQKRKKRTRKRQEQTERMLNDAQEGRPADRPARSGPWKKRAAKREAKKRQTTTETKPHCPFGFVSLAVAGLLAPAPQNSRARRRMRRRAKNHRKAPSRRRQGRRAPRPRQCVPTPCLAQRPPRTQEQQRPGRRQKQRRKQRPKQQPKQQRPKRQQQQQQKQKSNEPVAQPKRRAQTHCNFRNQTRARRFRPAPAAAKRNG